jgi:hypothetical protein
MPKVRNFPPALWYLLFPVRGGLVRFEDQFVPYLLQELLHSALFDGFKGNPVDSRSAIVLSGHQISFKQGIQFAYMDVQSPKPPGFISLRLDVNPLPQVMQADRRIYHSASASLID